MVEFSSHDREISPPSVELPRAYNAAHDFIDRHLVEGRGAKVAVIDDAGRYTYADLAEKVNRAGNALKGLGLGREQRVMMCLLDSVDFYATFWGAMKIGAVPVPLNTLLTTADYDYMLSDSRATMLVISSALLEKFSPILDRLPHLKKVILSGEAPADRADMTTLAEIMAAAPADLDAAETTPDDVAFWLYSSGSTGRPKGVVHLHSHLVKTAALYGGGILRIEEEDVVFSAAKLFFAYGLGNAMTFPLYVGATAVLMAERPTPKAVMKRLKDHQATIFYGVPTLYGAILSDATFDRASGSGRLRRCASAGEALPEDIGKRWLARFGVDILDGIGSTEMLHIFLSNRPGDVRYGTSGLPVPGYECRIADEDGNDVGGGELGELMVKGPSAGACYWNNREKSLNTFQGPWTRTGDKYFQNDDGYYVYSGRSDDMLKVGGIWVSPFEVESALLANDLVLEAAIIGAEDEGHLVKPKAYVVLKSGVAASDETTRALQAFVKDRLAPYKYPRWIEYRDALPKTATGKIQRFKLREA